jgi:hypothetical protein
MKMKLTREFYTSDYTEESGYKKTEGDGYTFYTKEDNEAGRYYVTFFEGKQAKSSGVIDGRYRTIAGRDEAIAKRIADLEDRARSKAERKAKDKAAIKKRQEEIKVGDIYVASWGYDQTNVDFYKVLKVERAFALIAEVSSTVVDDYEGINLQVVAGNEIVGDEMRKKIGKDGFKINSYITAYPWDGSPRYESGPYGQR